MTSFRCCITSEVYWQGISSCQSFFFSSRRRHTRYIGDWSSDVVLFRSPWPQQDHRCHVGVCAHWINPPAPIASNTNMTSVVLLRPRLITEENQYVHVSKKKHIRLWEIGRASCRERMQSTEGEVSGIKKQ